MFDGRCRVSKAVKVVERTFGRSMVACFSEETIKMNGLLDKGFVCIIFELHFLVSVPGSEATWDTQGYLGRLKKYCVLTLE